jgi:hypothetical protein
MITWLERLIVFWVVVVAVSVFAVIRGSSTDGEPRAVHTILGLLGIGSMLLFPVGWIRQSRRRHSSRWLGGARVFASEAILRNRQCPGPGPQDAQRPRR